MTIRSMHAAATGEAIAKMKMRALRFAFSGAFLLRFFIWGHHHDQALAIENSGWLIEWTPAFIGAGILVGLNTAFSFFGGSVLAWAIVGPALVHNNAAFGEQLYPDDPQWSGLVSFASLSTSASTKDTPSPRFWLLWPGVLLMIVVSFTELALQYEVFYFVTKAVFRGTCDGLNELMHKMKKDSPWLAKQSEWKEGDMVDGPASADELI